MVEIAKVCKRKSTDPRPSQKKAKITTQPRGEPQGDKGKVKDDDIVSLDYWEDEFDGAGGFANQEMAEATPEDYETGNNTYDTQDFGVDCEIADLAGLEPSFRQVY